jgi:hypothetical protein
MFLFDTEVGYIDGEQVVLRIELAENAVKDIVFFLRNRSKLTGN